MFLDSRKTYLQERNKLFKLSTKRLEAILGELYHRRFEQHDISIDAYYRLASQVYNTRVRTGKSLIYHLKNFLGTVVNLILISYLNSR